MQSTCVDYLFFHKKLVIMIDKIIGFSINNKLIIGLFILGLIAWGSYAVTQLPIDAVPDITDNQVQVITVTPSLGAPDVERLITFPIEQANSNIPGLKNMRSFSRFGLSLITLVFEDDVDIYWARQQVTERLKIAEQQIPVGIGLPELAPVTTGLGEIYQYVLRPKPGYEAKYNTTELRTIQDWTVRRQLIGIKGVAGVSSFGGKVKQYEIAIDAANLKAHNITVDAIFSALEKNNENTGGAYIEKGATVLYIRAEGLISSIDDINNIVVKNLANGTPLLIKDVAEVRIGNAIRYGAMTYNDEGEVAGAVVMMLKGENSNKVIKAVKEKVIQIQKTLPEGVVIEPFLDRTKMVNNAITTVSKNLMEGALIVIFVLVLFLGNVRAGFLVASVIPLAMLFAVIMMNIFGVSGNLMSLGALDFGLIVDGAVIIVEAVMHQLIIGKQKISNESSKNALISQSEIDKQVKHSASRMMNSAVFGQLVILIVYLPIFALEGIEGKMFKPMAQTVAFALLGAFILSLTYIPMMSALVLKKSTVHKKNISDKMMDFFIKIHQNQLSKILHFPKTVLGISIALFFFTVFILSTLGGEFIPELPEGDFAVETRVLTGSNINTSTEATLKSAHILLKQFPEIEKIIGKTGSGEIPTDPMPMEASDLMIILNDKSTWTSAKTWNELSFKMSEALKVIPGVTFSFQYPVAMRFNELMTGAKQDVVCKIVGENLDTLSKYSKLLGNIAAKTDGAENIYVEPIDGVPQLIINYNRNKIAQYGLNIKDINRVVNTAFAGQSSGLVFEDEKRFDLVVRLAGEKRQNITDVQQLLIPTPSGTQIPLNLVADVRVQESVNQIQREDAKRRIIVGFNVGKKDVQTVVNDLQTKVNKMLPLPSGYYITYGGAFENLAAAKKRLLFAVPLALLLIFVLLYFAFGSIKQGLLIYSAIPLSAIGGILFLAARGLPFSISAGIGFIALFGVAVLNGIVLIAEFNKVRENGETNLTQIVLQGTKTRLRPVLMTAFVASLGFLPMALSNGAGAEVQRPLATVVIGGLLIATFLTLFVLPVLYIFFDNKTKKLNPNAVLLIMGLFMFPFAGNTQTISTSISLDEAINIALKNNSAITASKLEVEYAKQLKKTSFDVNKTELTWQHGRYNSVITNDNYFDISQTFAFPTVYFKNASIAKATIKSSEFQQKVQENELVSNVKTAYYQLIYAHEKLKLMVTLDSLFSAAYQMAELNYKAGEFNLLQKTTAQAQAMEIKNNVQMAQADVEVYKNILQTLLQTNDFFELSEQTPAKKEITLLLDSAKGYNNNPALAYLQQEINVEKERKALEKAKLLPDLTIGYFNQSLIGTQNINGVEQQFTSGDRFDGFRIGIAIPLWFSSQTARIKAALLKTQISEANYLQLVTSLGGLYQQAIYEYQKEKTSLAYYENNALPQAELIINNAQLALKNGEVGFVEYMQAIKQAVVIKHNGLAALNNYNQAIIRLEYLAGNN